MLFAALRDTPYNVVLLLHVLTAILAFAPAAVHPILAGQMRGDEARGRLITHMTKNGRTIYAPALIVNGVLGFALAGMSDEVFKMSQGWLIAAFIVWVGMNGLLHAVVIPAEKAVAGGDDSAEARLGAGGGAITILLIVMLWLMIFKPGL